MSHTFGTAGAIRALPSSAGHLGQGVAYPLDYDPAGRLVMSFGPPAVEDAVMSILLTQPGERVLLPDYGADRLAFEPQTPERAQFVIQQAIRDYEPRITSSRVTAVAGPQPGDTSITVEYTIGDEATPRTLTAGWFKGPATTNADGT